MVSASGNRGQRSDVLLFSEDHASNVPYNAVAPANETSRHMDLYRKTVPCPMCATKLFEECPSCHAIRHSLLPACEKCGAEKAPVAANVR
jgi:hypothetical protein